MTDKKKRIEIKFVNYMIYFCLKLKLLFNLIFSRFLFEIAVCFSMKNFFVGKILKISISKTKWILGFL